MHYILGKAFTGSFESHLVTASACSLALIVASSSRHFARCKRLVCVHAAGAEESAFSAAGSNGAALQGQDLAAAWHADTGPAVAGPGSLNGSTPPSTNLQDGAQSMWCCIVPEHNCTACMHDRDSQLPLGHGHDAGTLSSAELEGKRGAQSKGALGLGGAGERRAAVKAIGRRRARWRRRSIKKTAPSSVPP